MYVVDYTESLKPGIGLSVRYKRERHWTGSVATGCNAVKANDPEIIEAYAKHGIPSYDDIVEDEADSKIHKEAQEAIKEEGTTPLEDVKKELETENTQGPEDNSGIPEDWRDLGWVEMRKLACSLTDEPVRNKKDAIRVIEENE